MPIYVRVVAILMVVVAVRLLAAPGRVGAVKPIGSAHCFYLAQAGAQLPFLAGNCGSRGRTRCAPSLPAFMIALLFSVFEESSRYLGFVGTATMRRNRDWSSAVLYGAGHGGTQALRFLFLGAALPALAATSSFEGHRACWRWPSLSIDCPRSCCTPGSPYS